MKLIRIITAGIMLFAIAQTASAQAPQPPKVIPPGPEVASLGKYLEHPVSLSSGVPSISIPIHTVTEGTISVPVSLSYHAGGIRVEEVASTVGLGWNLSAGGVISRTTKANPDDHPGGYMHTPHLVSWANQNLGGPNWMELYNLVAGNLENLDYEPDDFSFSFLNHQGRMFYDRENNKFLQAPFSNLKIEPFFNTSNTISSWKITDDKGTAYYFGKTQETTPRTQVEIQQLASNISYTDSGANSSISNSQHITAWHLLKIKSLNGDTVDFYYNTSAPYYDTVKTEESKISGGATAPELSSNSTSYVMRQLSHTALSKIKAGSQEVIFEQESADRLDLEKSKALKSISIFDKAVQVKKFNLVHDYFVSADTNFRWALGNPLTSRHRLRLLSVYESGTDGTALPGHEFTYNATELPNRTSYSQDAWGFFNGKGNTSLIPKVQSPFSQTYTLIGNNANRKVDEVKSKAAVLEKIRFPTGGTVEYIYENNRPGLVVNKNMNEDFNQTTPRQSGLFPTDAGLASPENTTGILLQPSYSREFAVTRLSGYLVINIQVEGCQGPMINHTDCHFTFKLKGGAGNSSFPEVVLNNTFLALYVPNGNYIIEASRQGFPRSTSGFQVAITWEEKDLEEISGGLRVKKIITSEDGSSPSLIKEFEYKKFVTGISSGYCINYPLFIERDYYSNYTWISTLGCNNKPGTYKLSSVSQVPMISFGSSYVLYENVTEYQTNTDDLSKNGKTEYTFTKNFFQDPVSVQYRSISMDGGNNLIGWRVGNLLKKEAYELKNNIYKKILTEENAYEEYGKRVINDFGINFQLREVCQPTEVYQLKLFKHISYPAITEWYRPTTSTKTEYFPSGNLVTTSVNTYADNPLLASSVTSNSSPGDVLESRFFYPKPGFTSSSLPNGNMTAAQASAVNTMAQQNNISTPVQVQEYKNEALLSTQRTTFRDWDTGTPLMIQPETVQASKGAGILEDRVRYNKVDLANGNPLEVLQEKGTKITYIWAYGKKLPVAKIENIAYASIPASLITDIQAASDATAYSETLVLQKLEALRAHASLAGAMVSTFTYRPLVGMTTATDPKGDRTTYEYDAFNRLKAVRDKDGNLLSENEYHYKNQ